MKFESNDTLPVVFDPLVSFFPNSFETLPTDIPASQFIASIKGNQHKSRVATIRERFNRALNRGVDYHQAKRAVDAEKKKLSGVTFAGIVPMRSKNVVPVFTGLFCADLDLLGDRLEEIRATLRNDQHVYQLFKSATGEGLKTIYRVPICKNDAEYKCTFATVEKRVQDLTGVAIDKLEDFSRLCYASHDTDAWHNPNALELPVVFTQPVKTPPTTSAKKTNFDSFAIGSRKIIAERIVGMVEWENDVLGHCQCPGEATHTTGEKAKECRVMLDGAPTVFCVHKSCQTAIDESNRRLRSEIGKSESLAKRNGAAHEYLASADEAGFHKGDERPLPEMVDAATFIAERIEPPAELVAGILHKGSKLALGGGSKSFKTWNLLDMALSVATGTDWLGFKTARGKVLFVNFEIQPHAWQSRIKVVARAKGIEVQPGQIHLWNLRGHAADYRKLIPKIIERARRENFALIILDPIYKLYGGTDENAAGDVAALLNSVEKLATETDAAVAFGAHFAKGNASAKEAIDRISGSGVFARDPDSLLIFTKHEADDAFTVEPILRNFAPVKPFAVRWKFPLMHRDDGLDPAKLKQTGGRKTKHHTQKLLDLLPPQGLTNSEWLDVAVKKGIGKSTFYDLRKDLLNSKKIIEPIAGEKWLPVQPSAKP